jgi:hypothetical protein
VGNTFTNLIEETTLLSTRRLPLWATKLYIFLKKIKISFSFPDSLSKENQHNRECTCNISLSVSMIVSLFYCITLKISPFKRLWQNSEKDY